MADRAKGIPIAREGLLFLVSVAVPALAAGVLGWGKTALVLGVLGCWVGWFFRNPPRTPPQGEGLILASGDGKVVAIQEEFEPRFLKDRSLRISVFLNIFDVHINRLPCSGTITDVVYQPGRFHNARSPEATMHNEHNALMIETPARHKVLCVQIAGLIARRIVCWVRPGDAAVMGERFGLIQFGSRVDTYCPAESRVRVRVGDRVKAGESILAEFA